MLFTPWLQSVRTRQQSRSTKAPRRPKSARRIIAEFLEQRALLAAGLAPQFVSVSPNVGDFLHDGDVRNEVPREFEFQFSPGETISAGTVSAIQVLGAGHDGGFTPAGVISDFGTNGGVLLRVGARRLGAADNGKTLTIATTDNAGNGPIVTTDASGNLTLTLDTNSTTPTTAQRLLTFAANNTAAKQILSVEILSGDSSLSLANAVPGSTSLRGAGAAYAINGFGVTGLNIAFEANQPGSDGNNIAIQVNRLDLGSASAQPLISVTGKRIEVTVNENASAPTTAGILINAINTHAQASNLVSANLVTGNSTAPLQNSPDSNLVSLDNSDRVLTASAVSGFQTTPLVGAAPLLIQFAALQQGIDGNEISLLINRANLGAASPTPTVAVTGKRITVTLNTNASALTTAADLVAALASSTLIQARIISGASTTPITTIASGTIIQLNGADTAVNPGYRGLLPAQAPDTQRRVIYRFAAPLDNDLYRVQVIGTGTSPLLDTDGERVNNGADTFLDVGLDLGATVNAVVPQPVIRQQLLTINSVANVNDGDTISIQPSPGSTITTFEFNDTSVASPTAPRTGNLAIDFNKTTATTTTLATAIANAINAATLSSPDVSAAATGSTLTIEGGAFNARVKLTLLNSGAITQREGSLVQRRNLVNVYFNDDILDSSLAQDVRFYRLINTNGSLVESDDTQLTPATATYDPNTHTAVLSFASSLPTATYKLRVGDSEELNDTLATAVDVGTVFSTTPYQHLGFIGDANGSSDKDLYRITIPSVSTIDVNVTPGATLNSVIRILDENGNGIAFSNGGATGSPDTLNFTTLTGGTFYVEVSSTGGTTGSYQVGISTTATFAAGDDNSSFTTATNLGSLGTGGQLLSSQIESQSIALPPPAGGSDEPGHREIPAESHGAGSGTTPAVPTGLGVYTYYFPSAYGIDSQGNVLLNQITEDQKTRAREIFEMYGAKFGFEVQESTTGGLAIVTGDPRAVDPNIPPDAVGGIAGGGMALMNARLNFTAQDNQFGGSWMGIALHEIGHAIGLGHSYDIRSDQGNGVAGEDLFNGNNDTVHGLRISPNNSTDIDMYQFEVQRSGAFSAEIVAERLATSSLLNSALRLYREAHAHAETSFVPAGQTGAQIQFRTRTAGAAGNGATVSLTGADLGAGAGPQLAIDAAGIVSVTLNTRVGSATTAQQLVDLLNLDSTQISARLLSGDGSTILSQFAGGAPATLLGGAAPVLFAQNDDYFSNDSYISLSLEPDTYYLGISSTGNTDYDPVISDTGFNGTTEGAYTLRLHLNENPNSSLLDATKQSFDGDNDGLVGGATYEFAFQSANTLVVDKTVVANSQTSLNSSATTVRVSTLTPFPATAGFQIRIDSEEMTVTAIDTVNRSFTVQRARNGTTAASHAFNAPVTRVVATTTTALVSPGDTTIPVANASVFVSQVPFIASIGSDRVTVTAVNTGTNQLTVTPIPNGYASGAVIRELGGTVQNPFGLIKSAVSAAVAGDTIRVVGNGGTDNDVLTSTDTRPYLLGFADSGAQLEDGSKLEIPQNVVLQVDAGAVIKLQGANLDAGTSAVGLSRSGGAMQILGNTQESVYFTSFENDLLGGDSDGVTDGANPGDWGGLVFRSDSDLQPNTAGSGQFAPGIFLNYVNHAELSYGGGLVTVNSVTKTYNSIHMVTARPTLSFNTISNGADAAMSADPDSFDDDRGRIGPDIYNNTIFDNTTNGLFVRIETLLGQPIQRLTQTARFDDTDITHIITQNLEIVGNPGGPLNGAPRPSGRLAVDPGVVVKLGASRIEGLRGNSALIAEGTAVSPVIFTSIQDDRFGNGGTFDATGNLTSTSPAAGDWGGLAFNANSRISLDRAYVAYGGGSTPIEGSTDRFNAVEIHHAVKARIANTEFDTNAGGAGGSRNGRGATSSSTIFVRQAQPIIVNNVFRNNTGSIIDINANAMRHENLRDTGRSTGGLEDFEQFSGNHGPLVRLNRVSNNSINGMNVRADVLTTESIWDDTDIVHVLTGEILVDQHHTYSGIRLQSNPGESLVVKLSGPNAGFTADGIYLEIDDRIGGTVQVIGQPGFPVVLTSLTDDSVGASFDPAGFPQTDTNNNGASTGTPGAWRSLLFTQLSNDRNVRTIVEAEHPNSGGVETNDNTFTKSEFLGELAPEHITGPTPANYNADDTSFRSDSDDNRPAGFEVQGFISGDDPGDVDIYSFRATGGNEVWIDLDRTRGNSLDPVVEVILADGTVVARSRYNRQTGAVDLSGSAQSLQKDDYNGGDYYSFGFRDTGFRITLPGTSGQVGTYFVRVRSNQDNVTDLNDDNLLKNGTTWGEYQLQIRERQKDEKPGSVIRYADIRFATNGIDVSGLPAHSPIVGENTETTAANGPANTPQILGNLLESDRNVISVGGDLSQADDFDFFRYNSDYADTKLGGSIQVIGGASGGGKTWSTVFDLDYADGLSRGDTSMIIFDSTGRPILIGRESNIEDDQPATGNANDLDDLTRGSIGVLDPFIGPVQMPTGNPGDTTNYDIEVLSNAFLNRQLNQFYIGAATNPLARLEPVNSTTRIIEDHIGFQGYTSNENAVDPSNTAGLFPDISTATALTTHVRTFDLGDVPLFVNTPDSLRLVNPLFGELLDTTSTLDANLDQTDNGNTVQDIVMRSDGRLWAYRRSNTGGTNTNNGTAGALVELDASNGAFLSNANDNIPSGSPAAGNSPGTNVFEQVTNTDDVDAIAWRRNGTNNYDLFYSVREDGASATTTGATTFNSKLYRADPATGSAVLNTGAGFGRRGDIQLAGTDPASGFLSFNDGSNSGTIGFQTRAQGTQANGVQLVITRTSGTTQVTGAANGIVSVNVNYNFTNNSGTTSIQTVVDTINAHFEAQSILTAVVSSGNAGTLVTSDRPLGTPPTGATGGTDDASGLRIHGTVTGMAFSQFSGGNLFGVTSGEGTSTRGSQLIQINTSTGTATIVRDFTSFGIGTTATNGFQGLALGPQNLQGGFFADKFFATTGNGRLLAFDATGTGTIAFDTDNEVQQIDIVTPGVPVTDGFFTLTFDNGTQSYTTDPIATNAPSAVTINEEFDLETVAHSGTFTLSYLNDKGDVTSLLDGIDDTTLTIVVDDATGLPTSNFVIRIDAEEMLVQSRTGTTLTIAASGRGVHGTVAAPHNDDAIVFEVLTTTVNMEVADAVTTTISVTDVTSFPATPFNVRIEDEDMQVTAVDSVLNEFTVVRGVNGTTASAHTLGATTLAADVLAGDLTISVTDVSSFPATTPFRIQVDQEEMLVTAVNAGLGEFTVTRGINGTAAVDHTAPANVDQVLVVSRVETTVPLNYNATAAEVQTALAGLASIGATDVTATNGAMTGLGTTLGVPVNVVFGNAFAGLDLADFTADTSNLVGDEIQRISLGSSFNGGNFTLSFNGATTVSLNHNATLAEIEAALDALATIGGIGGDVTVTGGALPNSAVDIQFGGTLQDTNVPAIVINSSSLTNSERQQFVITGTPTGGNFTITALGQTTGNIPFNATAGQVQAALETLTNIGAGNVSVTGANQPGNVMIVTFQNALNDTNVAPITITTTGLTGGTPGATVATQNDGNISGALTTMRAGQGVDVEFSGQVDGVLSIYDALVGLPTIGVNDIQPTGGALPGNPVNITFIGAYAGIDVNDLIANNYLMLNGTQAAVSTTGTVGDLQADNFLINVPGLNGQAGLAFSPLDFNLWHPTRRRGDVDVAGHGINAAYDNSRTPDAESRDVADQFQTRTFNEQQGGVSFYFGVEEYDNSSNTPYLNYENSNSQLGVRTAIYQADLTSNANIGNNYNLAGGAYGSLITDPFDLVSETGGETAQDRPTLYFNYFLQTQGDAATDPDGSMNDSARVFLSNDGGLTWDLVATNNSPRDAATELPYYASHSRLANNSDARQQVQELFDTSNWRQARVDLSDYVGQTGLRLRFDFSTAGTIVDAGVTSNDPELASPTDVFGDLQSPQRGVNNAFEGFYVDDIIVGWSERGEMITGATADKTNFQVPQPPASLMRPQELLSGDYQVEVRRGFEYAGNKDKMSADIVVNNTFDTNIRFIPGVSGAVDPQTVGDLYSFTVADDFDLGDVDETTFGFDPAVGWTPNSTGSNAPWAAVPVAVGGGTTLNVGISAAGNLITVADAAAFPAVGVPFILDIEGELVGAQVINTGLGLVGVVRGPLAVAHNVGAVVRLTNPMATSGAVSTLQRSVMSVSQTATGVSFRYRATADIGDVFRVYLDELGGEHGPIFQSNSTTPGVNGADADGFVTVNLSFDPGIHTLFFSYEKDGGDGADAIPDANEGVQIDNVVFAPISGLFVRGDRNVERQQGHFQIENNFIRSSANAGIRVTPGTRDPITGASPLGSAMKFNTQNAEQLAPSISISNNVIAGFGNFGIQFQGDSNVGGTASLPATMVPYGKIINNTIYGGQVATGTGVRVEINASPTLLNNLIANTTTGIFVDASSASTNPSVDRRTVVSRTFFQGNGTNLSGVTDASQIISAPGNPLFVNPGIGNFYLAAGSPAIDRSLNSQPDRVNFVSLRGQAGIPNSDSVAPATDVFGQTRVDDPTQFPSGIGGEVFFDLGAIERADTTGGVVSLIVPEDNSVDDLDPLSAVVHIDAPQFFNQFVVKFTDDGIGIDDSTVTASQFTLTETTRFGSRTLVSNVDYVFSYNSNTNEAVITSVTLFPQDARFTLSVDNSVATGIRDFANNSLVPNQVDGTVQFDILVTNGPNDPPINSVPTGPTIDENTLLAPSFAVFSSATGNAITVDDPDAFISDNRLRVTLTATNGTVTLPQNYATLVTLNSPSASGVSVSFTGTITDINTLLAGGTIAVDQLQFTPTQDFNGTATLQVTTNDLGNFSKLPLVPMEDIDNIQITVRPINSVPDAKAPSTASTNEDTGLTFTGGTLSVADTLDDPTNSSTVRVSVNAIHGVLTLSTTAGLTFIPSTPSNDGLSDPSLVFEGTITAVNTALNGLVYLPSSDFNGSDTLTLSVNDLGNIDWREPTPSITSLRALTDSAITTITVTASNDAPINLYNNSSAFPGAAVTALERTSFAFTGINTVSVSDVDVNETTGLLRVTLTTVNGMFTDGSLTLPTTTGLAFSVGDGTADTTMTFVGTTADINTALSSLFFDPNPTFTTAGAGRFARVTIFTEDLGASGAGAPSLLSDTDLVDLDVLQVNDPPSVSVTNSTETLDEDGAITFSTGTSNPITVAEDPLDAAPAGDFQLSIVATNGTISLNPAAVPGLSFTFSDADGTGTGSGSSDTSMVFRGSIAAINAALDGLVYTPTSNYNGSSSLSFVVNDRGQTGAGGSRTDSATVSLNVRALNDQPAVSAPTTANALEDTILGGPNVLTFATTNGNVITVADPIDGPNAGIYTAILTVTTATGTPGTLRVGPTTGAAMISANNTALVTITGLLADINSALDGLQFAPPSGEGIPNQTLTVTLHDNGNVDHNVMGAPDLTDFKAVTIIVDGDNDPPSITLPNPADQTLGEDENAKFGASVGRVISLSDPDDNGANLTLTLTTTNGTIRITNTSVAGLVSVSKNDTSSVIAIGTKAALNSALDGLILDPTADFVGTAKLTVRVDDNGNTGRAPSPNMFDEKSLNITYTGVNDAPTVTAQQSPIVVDEDSSVVLAVSNLNGVRIDDVDLGSGQAKVTLTVGKGKLTLSRNTGLTFSKGDGLEDSTMTFVGTSKTAINAALEGMTYQPSAGVNGVDTLRIIVNDQGHAGAGGPMEAIVDIPVTINAVNDAPTLLVPAAQSTEEDTPKVFNGGSAIQVNDVDVNEGTGTVAVVLSVDNGILTLGSLSNVSIVAGANGTSAVTFNAAISDANVALAGLTFTPTPEFSGKATLSVLADDRGNTGTGGIKSVSKSVTINVTSKNDAPINTVPASPLGINEDTTLVFTGPNLISISDVDAGTSTLQVAVSATNGKLTVTPGSGVVISGNASNSVGLQGTLTGLNAVLASLQFQPATDYFGSATVTIVTSDLGASGGATLTPLTDTDTITIAISSINDLPVGVADSYTVTRSGSLTASDIDGLADNDNRNNGVLANDGDVDTGRQQWTAQLESGPSHHAGVFVLNPNGTFAYIHNGDAATTDSFTYRISDGLGVNSTDVTVTIHINDAPVIVPPTVSAINENTGSGGTNNGTVVVDIDASDANSDVVTYSIVGGNTGNAFAIGAATGVITVANAAALNYEVNPTFTLTIQATDNAAAPASSTLSAVINLNDLTEAVTVPSTAWSNAGLTVKTDALGSLLRIVTTGTDTNAFAEQHALAKVSSLTINGRDSLNDRLVVDFVNGNPIPAGTLGGITYNGGLGGSDSLELVNGVGFNSITHNFTSSSSGSVTLVGASSTSVVRYSGLEPIIDSLSTSERVFSYGASNDNVTLSDGTAADGRMQIAAPGTGESVDFLAPTTSISVQLLGGADRLTISSIDSVFTGTLFGFGGDGNDTVKGASGVSGITYPTYLDGGAGNDSLDGGDGPDTLVGGAGDDLILGNGGNDKLRGGAGIDELNGGDGADELNGQGATGDRVVADISGTVVISGTINNTAVAGSISSGGVIDTIIDAELLTVNGSGLADNIDVSTWLVGIVAIKAGDGDDVVIGSPQRDEVSLGAGNDRITAGDGGDAIFGDAGNDTLAGNAGNDRLNGGNGNDVVQGGAGFDTLTGGNGADRLDGQGGSGDVLSELHVNLDPLASSTPIADRDVEGLGEVKNANTTITLTNTSLSVHQGGVPVVDVLVGIELAVITSGGGNDIINSTAWTGPSTVNGGAGNDKIRVGTGFNVVRGGLGNDSIVGNIGVDQIYGDETEDGAGGDDSIDAGAGNDFVQGGVGNDFIKGGAGNDKIYGQAGNDSLLGSEGNDLLLGGDGSDRIAGEAGVDTVRGDSGSDTLAASGNGTQRELGEVVTSDLSDVLNEALNLLFTNIL